MLQSQRNPIDLQSQAGLRDVSPATGSHSHMQRHVVNLRSHDVLRDSPRSRSHAAAHSSDYVYKSEPYSSCEDVDSSVGLRVTGDVERQSPAQSYCEGAMAMEVYTAHGRSGSSNSSSSGNDVNSCSLPVPDMDMNFPRDFDEDISIALTTFSRNGEFEAMYNRDPHYNPIQAIQGDSLPPMQMYTANVHSITPVTSATHHEQASRHDNHVKLENGAQSPLDLRQLDDARNGNLNG